MNKKYLYIFCVVGFLLVALVAAMLIGGAGNWTAEKVRVTTDSTETLKHTDGTQEQSIAGTSDQTDGSEDTPTLDVSFGVGDGKVFDETETIGGSSQNAEATQDRKPTSSVETSPGEQNGTTLPATAPDDGMPDVLLTYEQFIQLSESEQDAYFMQFADPREYSAWLRAAKQKYEEGQTSIIITGPIDLSTLPSGGN